MMTAAIKELMVVAIVAITIGIMIWAVKKFGSMFGK